MSRAEELAARLYRRAQSKALQREGFLEDALFAAFEEPEAWRRVRAMAGWTDLPEEAPSLRTQEATDGARTDLVLRWESVALVLELKAWGPPDGPKLGLYGGGGKRVSAIAAWRTHHAEPFLPMTTWWAIRNIPWERPPLAWAQLCNLIDEMGVAMAPLNAAEIRGIVPAWRAYPTIDRLCRVGADQVVGTLRGRWPLERLPNEKLEENHGRYARWAWAEPWSDGEQLGVVSGLYVGRPSLPTLVEDVPDLLLMLHAGPESRIGRGMVADGEFSAAVERWVALPDDGIWRSRNPIPWEVLTAREPLTVLLDVEDQEAVFAGWINARLREWVDCGIVTRIAELQR